MSTAWEESKVLSCYGQGSRELFRDTLSDFEKDHFGD